MQDLKLSSNLFKQGGISAVEKITFISCESKNRSYINWNNSLEHIIIDLYSIPKDESLRVTPHMTAMALPVDWMVESIIIFSRSLHCTWMLWMMGFTHASTFSRFLSEKKIALFKCWSIIHDHQEIKFNDIKLVPKFIEHTRRRPASAVVWMFLVAVVHWNRW